MWLVGVSVRGATRSVVRVARLQGFPARGFLSGGSGDKPPDDGGNGESGGSGSSGSGSGNSSGGSSGSGSGSGGGSGGKRRERATANALVVANRESLPERMRIGENAFKPPELLAVPIVRRPVFPGFMAPIAIYDEALVKALTEVKSSQRPYVGLFMVRDPAVTDMQLDRFSLSSTEQIHQMGVLASITQIEASPLGCIAMISSHRRVRITGTVARVSPPPLLVKVEHLSQPSVGEDGGGDAVLATVNEILATVREVMLLNPLFQQNFTYFSRKLDVANPYALADFAASITTFDAAALQDVLETTGLLERLNKALLLLKKELQLAQLQATIKQDVEKRIDKQQRAHFLHEQLKSIKKELGVEKDDKEALIAKFNDRVSKLVLPPTAEAVYKEEIEKLALLERNSSEFNVTRSYLDWITSLPWGKFSRDNFDTRAAARILDEDHYGMSDVKDRIIEFIAVGKLRGSVQGKILCLVGPPGVGKTSIGKSIARALDRQFFRFSVGGLSDVAEIKGHRRTYVGAMPGKLIQCLKATGVSNPLVLIDEVDKIGVGRGYSGDPSSALLEMLDPNQNNAFSDHYLDTPVDASKVLFICTANALDTIPGPLLDRMEVIRLAGYDAPEKLQIVKRYLEPKTRAEVGLEAGKKGTPTSLSLDDAAVEHLIRWYARESGVRNVEKLIGKIYRKAAARIVAAREAVLAKRAADAAALVAEGVVVVPDPVATPTVAMAAVSVDAAAVAAPAAAGVAPPVGGGGTVVAAVADGGLAAGTPAAEGAAAAGPASPEAVVVEAEVVDVEDAAWTITPANLEDYVGKPLFTSDRLYAKPPAGVAMGLAWTNMGGSALYIEVASPYVRGGYRSGVAAGGAGGAADAAASDDGVAATGGAVVVSDAAGSPSSSSSSSRFPSGGSLRLTGKMGDVMQESAQIAYTFARRMIRGLPGHTGDDFLDVTPLHMHVPEGATPKDGPSAGVTMTTALLSAALDRPIRADVAMTGEMDLLGTVMQVGGIKEKVMAARRAGVTCLVFPKGNKRDFDELPAHLRDGLEVHFAAEYADVYAVAFPPVGGTAAA